MDRGAGDFKETIAADPGPVLVRSSSKIFPQDQVVRWFTQASGGLAIAGTWDMLGLDYGTGYILDTWVRRCEKPPKTWDMAGILMFTAIVEETDGTLGPQQWGC